MNSPQRKIIRRDFWSGIQNLSERISRIDPVIFFTNDLVRRLTSHFEKIRLVQNRVSPPSTATLNPSKNEAPTFHIFSHLATREREEEFLTKLSEILVILFCSGNPGNKFYPSPRPSPGAGGSRPKMITFLRISTLCF